MSAIDAFLGLDASSIAVPATYAEAVTPSDTVDLVRMSRALWVGVTGNIKVTMKEGQVVTFSNLPVGWHPLRVSRVWSTSTTATTMIAVA